MNKELSILKWVGIALAALSTVFTLVIVGSHLSGRLVGLGKVGIVGTVGAEFMGIICAWLAASALKKVAGVAMLCQIVLTAVLLVNASIALDLDWQETQAAKVTDRQLAILKQAAEEQRKTIEAQANEQRKLIEQQGAIAAQLSQQDKRLARDFVKQVPVTPTNTTSDTKTNDETLKPKQEVQSSPISVQDLSIYERYGLTTVPLFLALLVVVALVLAAHSEATSRTPSEWPKELEVGK